MSEPDTMPDFLVAVEDRLMDSTADTSAMDADAFLQTIIQQLTPGRPHAGISPSGLGKCARQVAFKAWDYPVDGKAIDVRSKMVFMYGDVTEGILATLVKEGVDSSSADKQFLGFSIESILTDQQTVRYHLPDTALTLWGYPDGVIQYQGNPWAVLEVKSASSYAFGKWQTRFEDGKDPWTSEESYWWQVQAYMAAVGVDLTYVLTMDKASGALLGFYVHFLDRFEAVARRHLLPILEGKKPEDVPRLLPGSKDEIEPGKGGVLPWMCVYCPYYNPCWDTPERSYKRSGFGKKLVLTVGSVE